MSSSAGKQVHSPTEDSPSGGQVVCDWTLMNNSEMARIGVWNDMFLANNFEMFPLHYKFSFL